MKIIFYKDITIHEALEILEKRKEKLQKSHTDDAKRQLKLILELEKILENKINKNYLIPSFTTGKLYILFKFLFLTDTKYNP